MVTLLKVVPSKNPLKKLDAYFILDNGKEKIVSFGQRGARDFTLINDKNSKFYLPKKVSILSSIPLSSNPFNSNISLTHLFLMMKFKDFFPHVLLLWIFDNSHFP